MKHSNSRTLLGFALVAASMLLQGCATAPPSRAADGCVLGLQNGQQVMNAAWSDPMDAVITKVLDRGQSFVCPQATNTS